MKAKIKQTGEIVAVEPLFYAKIGSVEPMLHKNDIELLEPNTDIGDEQRRYEIAKEAVRGVALNADCFTEMEIKTTVENALLLADALIEELKKKGDTNE